MKYTTPEEVHDLPLIIITEDQFNNHIDRFAKGILRDNMSEDQIQIKVPQIQLEEEWSLI